MNNAEIVERRAIAMAERETIKAGGSPDAGIACVKILELRIKIRNCLINFPKNPGFYHAQIAKHDKAIAKLSRDSSGRFVKLKY